MVLEVENALNDPRTKAGYPAIGEDIKVMAVRHAGSVTMTIACAMVDRFIRNATDYSETRSALDASRWRQLDPSGH